MSSSSHDDPPGDAHTLTDESGPMPVAEDPGFARSARVLTAMHRLRAEPKRAQVARTALVALPERTQRYLALLLREGALSVTDAAGELRVDEEIVAEALKEIEAVLAKLL
jgi:hypothetical protein